MKSAPSLTLLLSLTALPLLAQTGANSSLAYDVPQGWSSSQDPRTGLVSLAPPGLRAPQVCVITVFTPDAFAGSGQAFHEEIVRRAISNARVLESPQQASLGAFLVTSIHQQMPNGLQLWSRIYTARWADRGQVFILAANMPDLANRFAAAADSMMSRIVVPSAPSQAASAPRRPHRPPASVRSRRAEAAPSEITSTRYPTSGRPPRPGTDSGSLPRPRRRANAAPSASGPWCPRAAICLPMPNGPGARSSRDS